MILSLAIVAESKLELVSPSVVDEVVFMLWSVSKPVTVLQCCFGLASKSSISY